MPGRTRLTEAVARHLFKLMAYKDEYEVARLLLKQDLAAAVGAEYPDGVRVHYNLHPPILRALGWKTKIRLGRWFDDRYCWAFYSTHACAPSHFRRRRNRTKESRGCHQPRPAQR